MMSKYNVKPGQLWYYDSSFLKSFVIPVRLITYFGYFETWTCHAVWDGRIKNATWEWPDSNWKLLSDV